MSIRQRLSLAGFLLVLLLFFFSGASGLVYQVIWVRLLTRIFGSTTFAVSALLAAFMAGLGLGSYIASRYLGRLRHPLRWFGLLEIGVGIYALFLNAFLPWGQRLFLGIVSGADLSLYGESLVKVVLSFIILVPPTTLMGASLPLLVKQTVSQLNSMGLRTGTLYAVNTLGAAGGCFIAGFFAIPSWGMESTTQAAALVNTIVGLGGIGMSFLYSTTTETASAAPSAGTRTSALKWAVAAFTLSGFAAIGLEVVWTRLFTIVLKGYTYSFTAMLTVLLLGIGVGSVVFGPRADRSRDLEGLLGLLQIAIGISALGLTALLILSDGTQVYLLYLFGHDWTGRVMSKFLVSLVVLGVPTFLFGAQFPVVSRIATEEARLAGDRVGTLYAMNVMGSIAGALITGFVFIPLWGTQSALRILTGSMVVMGVALVLRRGLASPFRRRLMATAAPALLLAVVLVTPDDLSRRIHEGWLMEGEVLSHYEEGASATVMVGRFPPSESAERILINGSSASNATNYGLSVNRIQGCLPFLFETRPKNALATCFGTGITFGTLGQFELEHIDGIDISPEVIRASGQFYEQNYGVTDNRRLTLHIDDGRNFLLKSRDEYDVITMEPMPPSLAGVSDMYTREFYELCKERLTPNGVMSQWVPLYYLTLDDVKMLYRTFAESFPHVMVFYYTFDTFLVGSEQPLRLSPKTFRDQLRSERLTADLKEIGLGELEEMYAIFLMDRRATLEFAGDAPVVTDDLPLVEFTGPRAADLSTTAVNYLEVTRYAQPVTRYLDGGEVSPEMRKALEETFTERRKHWDNVHRAIFGRVDEAKHFREEQPRSR
ncbi:MAG TPA: fused MFS/spermidine synthase [Vicinamibacteria bacterium]|nr:fused MFS/spermidine synthase [Vicinamibacteria bacterium]